MSESIEPLPTPPPSKSSRLKLAAEYVLIESLSDVTLLFTQEDKLQDEQRYLTSHNTGRDVPLIPYTSIYNCRGCSMPPSYNRYIATTLPESISRRFSLYCPKCSPHPIAMYTLEGMIGYWNRIRK